MAVYFIREGHDGAVKIGYSADAARRLVKLQADSSRRATIINQVDGDRNVERWLHWRFRDLRIRGEWFGFDNAMHTIQSELEGVDIAGVPPESKERGPRPKRADVDPIDLAKLEEIFGSRFRVAKVLGLPQTTVYTWFQKGHVPRWHHDVIRQAMQAAA